jgi:YHS domain-containing protein
MKTKLASIIIAAFTVVLASCATTASVGGAKAYPLKVCLVTGNDLNSMGDEQVITYEGRVLKFCCEPCVAKFKKNPAKYLAKLPN